MTTSSSSKRTTIRTLSFIGGVCTLIAATSFNDVLTGRTSIFTVLGVVVAAFIFFFLAYLVYKDLKKFKVVEAKLEKEKKAADAIRVMEIDTVITKIRKAEQDAGFKAIECTYLGGTGTEWLQNEPALLTFSQGKIWLTHPISGNQKSLQVDHATIIEISGPGTQTTNAGITGGGFGLEGFVKGVVLATAINSITKKSSTNTFLRVLASSYESYLHTSNIEPTNLRLILSPAFVHIESEKRMFGSSSTQRLSGLSIGDEIEKLYKLKESGTLSSDEFATAKTKLLSM